MCSSPPIEREVICYPPVRPNRRASPAGWRDHGHSGFQATPPDQRRFSEDLLLLNVPTDRDDAFKDKILKPLSEVADVLPGKLRRTVRGELTVSSRPRGALNVVLTTEREAVVASVVAAETEARTPEALKALAVVVRTFMLSHPNRHADDGFDFCDTTHCQLYRGESDLAAEVARPAVASAVAATMGEHLVFEGHVVEAYFTASCGGLTATRHFHITNPPSAAPCPRPEGA